MAKRYKNIPENEKEFYFYLGQMSTSFAKMEYNILTILGNLIIDDFVLTATILESNSLAQNIELLKKINKYRCFETNSLSNLISKIGSVRKNRNLFIHGIWGEPFEKENDLMIICREPKILYEEKKDDKKTDRIAKTWTSSKSHEFRLSYIKRQIEIIEDIITAQNALIKQLADHKF